MVPLFHSTSKGSNTAFYSNPALDKILDEKLPRAQRREAPGGRQGRAEDHHRRRRLGHALVRQLDAHRAQRPDRSREALGHLRAVRGAEARLRPRPARWVFFGYFLRRLSLVIPTLLGVTIITFTLTYVLPGNPAVVKAGPLVSPEVVKELEKEMGLDQPAWVQYWRYILGRRARRSRPELVDGRPVLEDSGSACRPRSSSLWRAC